VELDVFRRNGVKLAIKPGGAIGEWRIQGDGAQVAIDIYERDKILRHDLYDATTGDLVASVKQPADPSTLPQWAKTISQLQDESVPESASLSEERRKWIAKVMNELAEIRPGMTRKDISKVLTEEGGLSTRAHRTYVYVGCPYIKVDIEFNPVGDLDEVGDRPDDVVKTVSRPYLEYSIAD